jgi:hypothetical protein
MATKKIVTIELGAGSTIGGIRRIGDRMSGTLIRINPREAEGDFFRDGRTGDSASH